ncbi:MAG: type IV secretion system DNA-binding domain-containing protein [Ferruginibacter sp.]
MQPTLSEQLTVQFYEWEARGRGWITAPYPVDLEPPFEPFFSHRVHTQVVADDGKRPTIVSGIIDLFRKKNEPAYEEPESPDIIPFPLEDDSDLCVLRLLLSADIDIGFSETERLLLALMQTQSLVSFEITGTHTDIYIQFVCRLYDAPHVKSQIKAYFPACVIEQTDESLGNIIQEEKLTYIADYGLKDEWMRPLLQTERFDLDPFIGICAVMEQLEKGEQATIQILFSGTLNSWHGSVMRSVTDTKGDSFFEDAPEMLTMAEEKCSSPFFAVTIRSICQSNTEERSAYLNYHLAQTLVRMSHSSGNSLIPLSLDGYSFEECVDSVWLRQSHRLGMLLNVWELATFVHLPSASILSYKLKRDTKKTKALPPIALNNELVLGTNIHQGVIKNATLSAEQRLKHMHVIGATGTGKSTFLLNLITQDILQGKGVAVLDPHGDLIESILAYIPESRMNDVVIIDPSDSDFPVGFNILTAHSEIEKDILSSDLVAAFKRLSTSWGDQMNSVLGNAILAFLESTQGGTLVELRRFLIEKSFRDTFLEKVSDPSIVYYWQKEYPILRSNSIGPILTRLDTFLRPKVIRNMMAQNKSLDFENLLDTKKIILIKLSQGLIGTENSYLLGTFVVSKIHQAAMARQGKAKEYRSDFFVYIDEFQNFITPSMSSILSGARKYHLGLILAHQDMQQLVKYDTELTSSVLANAATRICFRIGDTDAKKFEDGFSYFKASDLQNLGIGEAIMRIDKSENDFSLTTTPLPVSEIPADVKNTIITHSRDVYGTPKEIVEKALADSLQVFYSPPKKDDTTKPIQPEKKEPQQEKQEQPSNLIVQAPAEVIQEIEEIDDLQNLDKRKNESHHRYLQTLIKKIAEDKGYTAGLEIQLPDGNGQVDVLLTKDDKTIAIEISNTTEPEWEMHNILKCIQANYDVIISVSGDPKQLEKIKKKCIAGIADFEKSTVHFFTPDILFVFLDDKVKEVKQQETVMKGYRINVTYDAVTKEEMDKKRASISQVVRNSLNKRKRKE